MKMKLLLATIMGAAILVTGAISQNKPRGQELFERRCSGCHSLDRDKEGPRLGGVYGRISGSVESFPYSDALRKAHITWNSESLERWLSGPDKLVPGSEMTFSVENSGERAAIIAWLKDSQKHVNSAAR